MSARKIDSVPSAKTSFGPLLLVEGLRHLRSPAEPAVDNDWCQRKRVVFADQQVGEPVAGQVDEPQLRVVPVDARAATRTE